MRAREGLGGGSSPARPMRSRLNDPGWPRQPCPATLQASLAAETGQLKSIKQQFDIIHASKLLVGEHGLWEAKHDRYVLAIRMFEVVDLLAHAQKVSEASAATVAAVQARVQAGLDLPLCAASCLGENFCEAVVKFKAATFYPFVQKIEASLSALVDAQSRDVLQGF